MKSIKLKFTRTLSLTAALIMTFSAMPVQALPQMIIEADADKIITKDLGSDMRAIDADTDDGEILTGEVTFAESARLLNSSGAVVYDKYLGYKGQLTDRQKEIYTAMRAAFIGADGFSNGYTGTFEYVPVDSYVVSNTEQVWMDIAYAYFAFTMDHPQLFWTNGYSANCSYRTSNGSHSITKVTANFTEKYPNAKKDIDAYKEGVMSAVEDIVSTTAKPSAYNCYLAIRSWLCNNCDYNYDALTDQESNYMAHSSAGAFIGDGMIVCQGYGEALNVLCQNVGKRMNIELLAPMVMSEDHLWNYVCMPDGKWYAVDVTWDDRSSGMMDVYFLAGRKTPGVSTTFAEEHVEEQGVNVGRTIKLQYPSLSEWDYDGSTFISDPYKPNYDGVGVSDKTVNKGTAAIDGKLDGAYKNSLTLTNLGKGSNVYAGTSVGNSWDYTANATAYAMYDNSYLYLFADVRDNDVLPRSKDWCTSTDNPINNDCFEFRVSLDGELDTIKVACDAAGYKLFGLADNYNKFDYSTIKYATARTSTGYTVEIAIPCNTSEMNMLKAGKVGIAYQINDRTASSSDTSTPCFSRSLTGETAKQPVFYSLSEESGVTPTDPVVTPDPVTPPVTEYTSNDVVKKGTAIIDGKLDEAYSYSLVLKDLGKGKNVYAGSDVGDAWDYSAFATAYVMYDDDYLYLFAEVKDDDVLPRDRNWCISTDNPINNDCFEFRVSLDGKNETIKVACDAAGHRLFGLAANYDRFTYPRIKYETTMSNSGYTIEIAIPHTGGIDVTKAGKVGIAYQINDRGPKTPANKTPCFSHSFKGEEAKQPVFYTLSKESAKVPDTAWQYPFTDIERDAPYADAIEFVYTHNLFKGVSETEFAPDMTVTRSMFVTVLGRLEGVDTTKYTGSSFSDSVAGSWYAPYVEWASKNNIVNGYGNAIFGVEDSITVEQAAVIMARYAAYKGISTDAVMVTHTYSDAASISSWAASQLNWAVANGIYEGDNGRLNPGSAAKRYMVAEIIYKYVTVFGEK